MLLLLLLSNGVDAVCTVSEFCCGQGDAAGVQNDLDRWRPAYDRPNPIFFYNIQFSFFRSFLFV
jgi:hypothetical protein